MVILVAEDDTRMAKLLSQALSEEGHAVVVATDGTEALSIADSGTFDVIVLDIMLPGVDGFEIIRRLRRVQHNQTPVLVLTARDAKADVVEALNLGADDYLTKPFSFEVLDARVRAVARRGPIPRPVTFTVGDLHVNQGSREVRRGSRIITLTRTEYSMLEVLMRNAGRGCLADVLIARFGGTSDIESNTIDAFVKLLRGKLEQADEPKLIHTVRGFGYCLRSEV